MGTLTVRYGDSAETRLTLERGQIASTTRARGMAIECVRGTAWVTFASGGPDHVLEPGDRRRVCDSGRMVIEAVTASELVFIRAESSATLPRDALRQMFRAVRASVRSFIAGGTIACRNVDKPC